MKIDVSSHSDTQKTKAVVHTIRAVTGRGFRRAVSTNVFDNGDFKMAEDWQITLKTADDRPLFPNSWISFDSEKGEIVGFPLTGNEGKFRFLLTATGKSHTIKRGINVIVKPEKYKAMHKVEMKLRRGFRDLVLKSKSRISFAGLLADYLRINGIKAGMTDIWITRADTNTYSLIWVLSSFNRNSCSEIVTAVLPKKLILNGRPHPMLVSKLNPEFQLKNVSVLISNSCPRPAVKGSSKEATNPLYGPLALVIVMLGLCSPVMAAYVIKRTKRKREWSRNDGDGHHVFHNGAAQAISSDTLNKTDEAIEQEDKKRKFQYRWSPDMNNRPLVVVPSVPPPRQNNQNWLQDECGCKSSRWHGLPERQCAGSESGQLSNFVGTIALSAQTLKKYISGDTISDNSNICPDSNSVVSLSSRSKSCKRPSISTHEDTMSLSSQNNSFFGNRPVLSSDQSQDRNETPCSELSEGSRIFDSALSKMSSLVSLNKLSTPKLIRVFLSLDEGDSGHKDNGSVVDRRGSASSAPTPSRTSMSSNSLEIDPLFSISQSLSGECSPFDADKWSFSDSFLDSTKDSSFDMDYTSTSTSNTASFDEGTDSMKQERKYNPRRPLKRMPTLHPVENDVQDERVNANIVNKPELLHPWYGNEYHNPVNVHVQEARSSLQTQISYTRARLINRSPSLQTEVIYEIDDHTGPDEPSKV